MEQKIPLVGGLNTDDSEYIYDPKYHLNAENIRLTNIETGKQMSVGFVPSNKLNSNSSDLLSSYSGNFTCIGKYEDKENQCIYYFLYNDQGNHLIVKYDRTKDNGGNPITVLADNKNFYNNGFNIYQGLNFTKDIITGISKVGDILSWTDNNNDVGMLNVTKPLSSSSYKITNKISPQLADENITLIRRPPGNAISLNRTTSSSIGVTNPANLISGYSFQFAFRYIYLDGQPSVLSPYSLMSCTSHLTGTDEPDVIVVTIPLLESIPIDIKQIDIAVREGNSGDFFVVKSWNINSDLTVINQHNSGAKALGFNFFNNQTGSALDSSYVAKPFDSVPLKAKALEGAENKFFISNYTEGYNAPSTSSLTVKTVQDNLTTQNATGNWWRYDYKLTSSGHPMHHWYLLFVADIEQWGYYFFDGYSGGPDAPNPYPTDLQLANGVYYGQTADDIANTRDRIFGGNTVYNVLVQLSGTPITTLTDTKVLSANGRKEFKSSGAYQMGVVFYDQYLRNCGTITYDDLKITIPSMVFNPTGTDYTPVRYIQWNLSNDNASVEIPSWAVYYSIVRTRNLRYQSFIQAECNKVAYYLYDQTAANPYTFNTVGAYSPAPTFTGVAIDISLLDNNKMGYTYQAGDLLNLYIQDQPVIHLNITGQYGTWVLCNLQDVGPLFGLTSNPGVNQKDNLFEIFTPYKGQLNEPFYEVGSIFGISSPGTSDRSYSTTQGYLWGDITILLRTVSNKADYYTEAMNADDSVYLNWDTDLGRLNAVITQPGQIINKFGIRYSEQYIQNTSINGLSSFDSLNEADVPTTLGSVLKLQLTTKMEKLGTVMLAIGPEGVISLYLDETQVQQQQGTAFVAASEQVIGTMNPLRGGYGTFHPESVVENDGNVWWYCINKACVVQYSTNGLYPISDFKLKSFLNNRSKSLLQLMAGGTKVNVIGGIDNENEEYLISFPSVSAIDNGVLDGFLLDDGSRKTIGFNIKNNIWISSYDIYPELFSYVNNILVGFLNGKMYVFGTTNGNVSSLPYNNFFGVQYHSKISKVVNPNVPLVKYMQSITVEGNICPSHVVLVTYYTYSDNSAVYQSTDLYDNEFNWKEGIWYGVFFRDSLTPGQPSADQALQTGDKMRGQWGYLLMDFEVVQINGRTPNLVLNSLDIGYNVSPGAKTFQTK